MKKKKKIYFKKLKILFFVLGIIWWISLSFAYDKIWEYIKTQSSNSRITVSKHLTTYYVNKNNDYNAIWDYLKGYYYDSVYWYFRLDWSDDLNNNVHFSSKFSWDSTKCSSGTWYTLSWFAYSKYYWYINFDYWTWVYYCVNDNKLHWFAYSDHLWYQSFEGIKFNIIDHKEIKTPDINDKYDINSDTTTKKYDSKNRKIKENSLDPTNNNWNNKNIGWWDKYIIDTIKQEKLKPNENSFWIIK